MNKKLNKKLLNLIALCSGITATVAVGIGGVIYSLRQEKNGGDEPVDQKVLPEEVYEFSEDGKTLLGFQDAFLNDSASPIYKDNFKDCNTMQIPASLTSIGINAFYDYHDSSSTIPSFITRLTFEENSNCSWIDHCAFYGCSSLTSVSFSKNLITIRNSAFHSCFNLTSVDLLNCSSLTYIGWATFKNCSSLVSADFSNTKLETLDSENFKNCSRLISIKFPSTVTRVYNDVFQNCSKFSSITWDRWTGSFDSLARDAFSGVCPTGGTVTVINPIDDAHNSAALLAYLKQNSGLPESWIVA